MGIGDGLFEARTATCKGVLIAFDAVEGGFGGVKNKIGGVVAAAWSSLFLACHFKRSHRCRLERERGLLNPRSLKYRTGTY